MRPAAAVGGDVAQPTWRWGPALHLALSRWWLDRRLNLLTIVALALPTLMMGGLARVQREGVNAAVALIDGDLRWRLLTVDDGNTKALDADAFARIRHTPGVAFVVPWVRAAAPMTIANSAAASASVAGSTAPSGSSAPALTSTATGEAAMSERLELWATAAGDPLLAGRAAPEGFGVVVGAATARRLQLSVGQRLRFAVHRQRNGATETAPIELEIMAIRRPSVDDDDAPALVALPLLESLQAWVEGHAVKGIAGERRGDELPARSWTRLRLYTEQARDLPAIAAALQQQGLVMRSPAALVADVQALQRSLTRERRTLVAIAWAAGLLLVGALSVIAHRRHRDEHRLLRITGHGRAWLWSLQMLHALVNATLTSLVVALAMLAGWPLRLPDLIEGGLVVLAVSLAGAAVAGWRAARTEASLSACRSAGRDPKPATSDPRPGS